ncbi:MAG: hybrid sensor histidine kinase/response regulator, partial [Chromatiaceae bacterium]|nr:hybrid sensor histidine kinase/response regulator [Chromatiaceae bacterium]
MTIRAKFATGLICILVVNLMAGLYAFRLYQRANSQAAEVREASSQIVATALSTQVRFKKQVQEWKNILLRGQDPALFDQYLAQFENEEQNTRASMQRLIELLGENLAARETAGQFLEAHTHLGEEYRLALGQHRLSDEGASLGVDERVRGIDRQPTDLLDKVVEAARAHKDQTLANIDISIAGVERHIFLIMVGVMTGAIALLILLVDRTIGQPIATATAIARRV